MKLSEFIKELSELDPNLEVILSQDGEGNGYSPYYGFSDGLFYTKENSWSGDVSSSFEQTQGVPCVVLWPSN